jgi:hypothetical protein
MPYFQFTATISPVLDGLLLLQSFFDTFVFILLHKQTKKQIDFTVSHSKQLKTDFLYADSLYL